MVRIVNGIIVESGDELEEYEANEPLIGGNNEGGSYSTSCVGFFKNLLKDIFTLDMKFWIIAAITIVFSLLFGGPWTLVFNCVFLVFIFLCIKFQGPAMRRMREFQEQQQQQQQQQNNPNQPPPNDPRTTVNSNNTMLQNPNAGNRANSSGGISRGAGLGRGNVFTLNDIRDQNQENQNNQ